MTYIVAGGIAGITIGATIGATLGYKLGIIAGWRLVTRMQRATLTPTP